MKTANAAYIGSSSDYNVAPDADLTRPANTTAYAANNSIGSSSNCLLTYSNFFEAAGDSHLLTEAALVISGAATVSVPSGISVRAYLFNADPSATVLSSNADQATFKLMLASMASMCGYVDFSTFVTGGTNSDAMVGYGTPIVTPKQVKAAGTSRALYAILVATGAFTPISAAVHRLYLSRAGL